LSISKRAKRAGSWVVALVLLSQALRFASNLILARLLFPEAFGLMAIVSAVVFGVGMVLDLGIGAAIVVKREGADAEFLETAWVMQIIRSAAMATVVLLAAHPLSWLYGQPRLVELMAIVALGTVVGGFASTRLHLTTRDFAAGLSSFIELSSQLTGVATMAVLAWHWRDPSSLAWGNVASALVTVFASHTLLPGSPMRWCWKRTHVRALLAFGGMAIPSSLSTFAYAEGTKLLAARLMDLRLFALMNMALVLTGVASVLFAQLAARVLLPAYAEIARDGSLDRLRAAVFKARCYVVLGVGLSSVGFTFFGDQVFNILYDARYRDGGLMMRVLALGLFASALSTSYYGVLIALEKLGTSALLHSVYAAVCALCMLVGWYLMGDFGVLIGYSVSGWLIYPVTAWVFYREGLSFPRFDAAVLCASVGLVAMSALVGDWSVLAR
jgi:O-antigen/teichoic acid export membrane protein